jgi:hypothetical protein
VATRSSLHAAVALSTQQLAGTASLPLTVTYNSLLPQQRQASPITLISTEQHQHVQIAVYLLIQHQQQQHGQ